MYSQERRLESVGYLGSRSSTTTSLLIYNRFVPIKAPVNNTKQYRFIEVWQPKAGLHMGSTVALAFLFCNMFRQLSAQNLCHTCCFSSHCD